MEKIVVNPEAELPERPDDMALGFDQLAALTLFASMKKAPSFEKLPGAHRLRRYRRGDVICYQGEPGRSAFYMLTSTDVAIIEASAAETNGGAAEPRRRLATARLMIDAGRDGRPDRGWWARWFGSRGQSQARTQLAAPESIPNDGPTDIDFATREAPIYAGDVFGEMSCLTRQPRSATIVADEDCFALEFLRNVLDAMLRDPQYKEQARAKYRERVMQGHLRGLSLFRHLTDEQFRRAMSQVELIEAAPGAVLWDEGDEADAALVVRSGVVKVVKGYPWRLESAEVSDWKALASALASQEGPLGRLSSCLSENLHAALGDAAFASDDALKSQLLQELNALSKTKDLLLAKELAEARDDARFKRETAAFGPKPKDWYDLETRRANRVLYHVLAPTIIKPPEPVGAARVRRYVGRGGTLGEIAVCGNMRRLATCVAYSHPGAGIEATNVELVRVPAAVLKDLLRESPQARAEIDRTIQEINAQNKQDAGSIQSVSHSRRVEELGLMQGQNLMLIDLERCTRCGDCVEACIDAHDDGFSRLYLDGPRIGKYLAPSSCRKCRDPVCMIGCPVGSIQQGESGEIIIREWCIGCRLCADQCPYDSIQMQDLSLLGSGRPGWRWLASGQSPGAEWFSPRFADREWQVGATPFRAPWARSAGTQFNGAGDGSFAEFAYYFRFRLQIDVTGGEQAPMFQLKIDAGGGDAQAYLDGAPIALQDPDAEKKAKQEEIRRKQEEKLAKAAEGSAAPIKKAAPRKEEVQTRFVATIPAESLQAGSHLVAVAVKSPAKLDEVVFDLSLQRLPREHESVTEKLVDRRAVVCDQCSSLSGGRHACVYACPHEAAIRVDGWTQLPEGESRVR